MHLWIKTPKHLSAKCSLRQKNPIILLLKNSALLYYDHLKLRQTFFLKKGKKEAKFVNSGNLENIRNFYNNYILHL